MPMPGPQAALAETGLDAKVKSAMGLKPHGAWIFGEGVIHKIH